jgi:hypothetical protein
MFNKLGLIFFYTFFFYFLVCIRTPNCYASVSSVTDSKSTFIIKLNGAEDFNDQTLDFQSVAKLEVVLTINNVIRDLSLSVVSWSVTSVKNTTAPWWLRSATAKNGLAWGNGIPEGQADGTYNSWQNDIIEGIIPTRNIAYLTDVVGSRQVEVEAQAIVDGENFTTKVKIDFGDGPLSIFTSAPVSGIVWGTKDGNSSVGDIPEDGDFTDNATEFPAADICGGTVKNTNIILGGSSGAWSASFGAGWSVGTFTENPPSYGLYYAEGSNLPKISELRAVSKFYSIKPPYSHSQLKQSPGKGAAFAAGWLGNKFSSESDYPYWTGEVLFYGGEYAESGFFGAANIFLGNSRHRIINVNYNLPTVVCVRR